VYTKSRIEVDRHMAAVRMSSNWRAFSLVLAAGSTSELARMANRDGSGGLNNSRLVSRDLRAGPETY
jgi:hypothetical protein